MSADFDLEGNLPKGSPIDVTFSLDSNGLLDVLAVEPNSGRECPLQIQTSGLGKDEVERIKSTALSMHVE